MEVWWEMFYDYKFHEWEIRGTLDAFKNVELKKN